MPKIWVVVTAFLVVATAVVLLQMSDVIPADIAVALRPVEPRSGGGMDLMIVEGPPSDATKGRRIALFIVVLGSVPVAAAGIALATYTRRRGREWSSIWLPVFQACYALQLCGVGLSGLMLVVLLVSAPEAARERGGILYLGVAAAATILFAAVSALGVKSWRTLQVAAGDGPVRLVR